MTSVVIGTTVVGAERESKRRTGAIRARAWTRSAFPFAWPTLLVASIVAWFGGTGLASPDDGFILAQSRRILAGQIPHRDFVSPRPAGSALLHTIDFALPFPLLQSSRIIATIEVVAYTLAFARLAYGRPLRAWSTVQIAGAAAAAFVNLHSFPLMAWHTIDGLFFVGVGLAVLDGGLRREHRGRISAGLILLGCALVMKQSFAVAPLIGLAMVWSRERTARDALLPLRRAVLMAALPGALYAVVVAAAGGLVPMVSQMAHAQPAYGAALLTTLWRRGPKTPVLLVCVSILCLIDARAGRRSDGIDLVRGVARAGMAVLVVGVLLVSHTDPHDAWGRRMLFILVVVVAWEWIARRQPDRFALVMIAVGWMTSLSWGYPTPRLVAGSLALVIVDRLWRGASRSLRWSAGTTRIAAFVAVATAAAIVSTAVNERAALSAVGSGRDATLEQLAPDLRGLRTDPTAGALLHGVAQCQAMFPARWTAVLPGPAIVYPVMNLDNPFSADWLYPLELRGTGDRLVREARTLDARGNYLVLVSPDAASRGALVNQMLGELTGARAACGGFVAVHSR